jgi:nucleoside phosphorylase
MKKKLLLFSTLEEAHETLLKHHSQPVEKDLWEYPGGLIAICGWGCENAYNSTLKYGFSVDEIWNIGIAGALKCALPLGSLHQVSSVGKSPTTLFSLSQEGLRLFSSDVPLHDATLRDQLAKHWDLVDMEGYGIALACHTLKKPCTLWKLVSDFASEGGSEIIRKHMSKNSKTLARIL